MKRIKFRLKNAIKKAKNALIKAKNNHVISEYIKNNQLFLIYVITCLINATMLRFFCIHSMANYLSIKAIMGDLAVIVILGSYS